MWNASIHRTHTPPKSAFDWWARLSFGRRKALTNGVTAHKRQRGARLQSISRGCGQHHPNSHLSMMSYGPACECVPSHPSTVCLLNLRRAWFIILRTREKCMCARGKKNKCERRVGGEWWWDLLALRQTNLREMCRKSRAWRQFYDGSSSFRGMVSWKDDFFEKYIDVLL